MTTNEKSMTVQHIVNECVRRAKMAHEQELEARLRGNADYAAYLLGIEHAYTSAYYQITTGSFTDWWKR